MGLEASSLQLFVQLLVAGIAKVERGNLALGCEHHGCGHGEDTELAHQRIMLKRRERVHGDFVAHLAAQALDCRRLARATFAAIGCGETDHGWFAEWHYAGERVLCLECTQFVAFPKLYKAPACADQECECNQDKESFEHLDTTKSLKLKEYEAACTESEQHVYSSQGDHKEGKAPTKCAGSG
jgi:hypothetical protein